MAPVLETSSASPLPTLEQLRARAAALERGKELLDKRLALLRQEIAQRIDTQTAAISPDGEPFEAEGDEGNSDFVPAGGDFSDLLADPSYKDDEEFKPSPLDLERQTASMTRRMARGNVTREIEALQNQLTGIEQRLSAIPAAQARLEKIAQGRRMLFFRTRRRAGAQREFDRLQQELDIGGLQAANLKQSLAAAQERRDVLPADEPYDASLHDRSAVRFLGRRKQAVLLSFSGGSDATVTLRLPRTPDDTDFGRVVSFEIKDRDLPDMIDLLGTDLKTEGYRSSLWNAMDSGLDLDDELVPLALEVVEVDGKEQLRLPNAVLDKFESTVVS